MNTDIRKKRNEKLKQKNILASILQQQIDNKRKELLSKNDKIRISDNYLNIVISRKDNYLIVTFDDQILATIEDTFTQEHYDKIMAFFNRSNVNVSLYVVLKGNTYLDQKNIRFEPTKVLVDELLKLSKEPALYKKFLDLSYQQDKEKLELKHQYEKEKLILSSQ